MNYKEKISKNQEKEKNNKFSLDNQVKINYNGINQDSRRGKK